MPIGEAWREEDMTPWFSGLTHPIQPGLYKIRLKGHPEEIWGRYSDARWRVAIRELKSFDPYHLPLATLEWRGVTEEAYRLAQTAATGD